MDGCVPLEGQVFTPRGLGVVGDRLDLSGSNVAFGASRVLVYQLDSLPLGRAAGLVPV
jgi:hypothetical protein